MRKNADFVLYQYVVTLRHDCGRIRIQTAAVSAEAATALVCRAEMAPRRSVLSVRRIDKTETGR